MIINENALSIQLTQKIILQDGFSLKDVLIDGKHTPSANELISFFEKTDLESFFKDTVLVKGERLALSFNSLTKSHLFVLFLGAKATKDGIFYYFTSDSFFNSEPLKDYRIDGNQFSINEEVVGDRIILSMLVKYSDAEQVKKYSAFLASVLAELMPHLSKELEKISL